MQEIKDKIELLPENLKKEVLDYIEFLLKKYKTGTKKKKFTLDWAGGLSSLKKKYSSVELQHKAIEWR
jgi:hypothetical protein